LTLTWNGPDVIILIAASSTELDCARAFLERKSHRNGCRYLTRCRMDVEMDVEMDVVTLLE